MLFLAAALDRENGTVLVRELHALEREIRPERVGMQRFIRRSAFVMQEHYSLGGIELFAITGCYPIFRLAKPRNPLGGAPSEIESSMMGGRLLNGLGISRNPPLRSTRPLRAESARSSDPARRSRCRTP
jgi:hypothetical protein